MKHRLIYSFDQQFKDKYLYCEEYSFYIDENDEDVIAYWYEFKYDRKYDRWAWYDKESENFVRKLQDSLLHNQIDVYSFYEDCDVKKWLEEKYKLDALKEFYEKKGNN